MDRLDILLFEAWHRISAEIRAERIRALRRSRRRLRTTLTHPMRESCLVIRATDTRINDYTAVIEPHEAYEYRDEHMVTISGSLIRRVTKPVDIPWPGVTYEKAAEICGRDYMTIAGWVNSGIFRIDRYPEFGFPPDGKRVRRPYVWTPSPIDPNAIECRPPHPIWGTLWQSQWEKMPEDHELKVRRVPHKVKRGGKECFRGWYWLCPGRLNENGEHQGCGRKSLYLYAPQSIWTLGQAIGDLSGFDMPDDSGLAGQWVPALHDASKATGPRSFACRKCWKVHCVWMAHYMGWNDFITHVSGGLLYGRDVPRPPEFPIEAIRYPKKGKKGKRGAKVIAGTQAESEDLRRAV